MISVIKKIDYSDCLSTRNHCNHFKNHRNQQPKMSFVTAYFF